MKSVERTGEASGGIRRVTPAVRPERVPRWFIIASHAPSIRLSDLSLSASAVQRAQRNSVEHTGEAKEV